MIALRHAPTTTAYKFGIGIRRDVRGANLSRNTIITVFLFLTRSTFKLALPFEGVLNVHALYRTFIAL